MELYALMHHSAFSSLFIDAFRIPYQVMIKQRRRAETKFFFYKKPNIERVDKIRCFLFFFLKKKHESQYSWFRLRNARRCEFVSQTPVCPSFRHFAFQVNSREGSLQPECRRQYANFDSRQIPRETIVTMVPWRIGRNIDP